MPDDENYVKLKIYYTLLIIALTLHFNLLIFEVIVIVLFFMLWLFIVIRLRSDLWNFGLCSFISYRLIWMSCSAILILAFSRSFSIVLLSICLLFLLSISDILYYSITLAFSPLSISFFVAIEPQSFASHYVNLILSSTLLIILIPIFVIYPHYFSTSM